MKEVLNILIEYVISYVMLFILYFFIFVRKKTKYNKNKVPVEFYYLVSLCVPSTVRYGIEHRNQPSPPMNTCDFL